MMEFFYQSVDGTEDGSYSWHRQRSLLNCKATGYVEVSALRLPTQAEIDASFDPQLDRFRRDRDILGVATFDRAAALVKLKAKEQSSG